MNDMGKSKYPKTRRSKFVDFLTGRGFYIALALSLIGAGTAAWFAVDRTLAGISSPDTGEVEMGQEGYEWNDPDLEEAGGVVSNVSRSSASSASSQSVSSASSLSSVSSLPSESSEASASSEAFAASTKSPTLFMLPLGGEIVNPYSGGTMVKSVTLGDWRTHDGVDLAGSVGTPVNTVADGVVTEIYKDDLWGTVVVINHGGGLESVYCSLGEKVNVLVGEEVEIGQVIGSIGETADVEIGLPAHLHFAMRQNGEWVDPFVIMNIEVPN